MNFASNRDPLSEISENQRISALVARLPRSPHVLNSTHTSDAEHLDVVTDTGQSLVLTTDLIVEEIHRGLYDDPWLIGWMAITTNMSDLAAVGAQPLGILLNITFEPSWSQPFRHRLLDGMADALQTYRVGVIGGDTNDGPAVAGGTALGLVPSNRRLTRTGLRPDDKLFVSGPAGLGNAFAFLKAMQSDEVPPYRPVARLSHGHHLAPYMTACMDTSDALLGTVDQLARLNGLQIHLHEDLGAILHPSAQDLVDRMHLPRLAAIGAIHGDFELCFGVAPDHEDALRSAARRNDLDLLEIGCAHPAADETVGVYLGGRRAPTAKLRNLSTTASSSAEYANALLDLCRAFAQGDSDGSP